MLRSAKADFVREHPDYGYGDVEEFEERRRADFPTLLKAPRADAEGLAASEMLYVDFAGAAPLPKRLLEASTAALLQSVPCNPHSSGPMASATQSEVDAMRRAVLDFLGASPMEYECVFTSGATAAIKLLGESFPWEPHGALVYTDNVHNSVVGVRELAKRGDASVFVLPSEHVAGTARCGQKGPDGGGQSDGEASSSSGRMGHGLFCYPAESNFDGLRMDLSLCRKLREATFDPTVDAVELGSPSPPKTREARKLRWWSLLDVSKFVATSALCLSGPQANAKPDFAVLSFYKIFGYPTGLGALVCRREALSLLVRNRAYFGGGTLAALSVYHEWRMLHGSGSGPRQTEGGTSAGDSGSEEHLVARSSRAEALEDGSLNYVAVLSLRQSFEWLSSARLAKPMDAVQQHADAIASWFARALSSLRHGNDLPVARLYGRDLSREGRNGPVVTFNLLRASCSEVGSQGFVGYAEVERLLGLEHIQLRTGCFCNSGSCMKGLGLSYQAVRKFAAQGKVCGDDHDVVDGQPRGCVRISFGMTSCFEDAFYCIEAIKKYFVARGQRGGADEGEERTTSNTDLPRHVEISRLYIYPIKSCAAQDVTGSPGGWPLTGSGLLYDRHFAIVDDLGKVLRASSCPHLVQIKPRIDLEAKTLTMATARSDLRHLAELVLPIEQLVAQMDAAQGGSKRQVRICARDCNILAYAGCHRDQLSTWLSSALGQQASLVAVSPTLAASRGRSEGALQSFANSAKLLLIAEESVRALNHRINAAGDGGANGFQVDHRYFRPNLVAKRLDALSSARLNEESDENAFWEDSLVSRVFAIRGSAGRDHAPVLLRGVGPCSRCSMVDVNPDCGAKTRGNPTLRTLAAFRRGQGSGRGELSQAEKGINFGVYLDLPRRSEVTDGPALAAIADKMHPGRFVIDAISTTS
mmetsp:Transcript_7126/g.27295  ORF Transcript_7126/g.27295 Transcript_7126/m.27295 type:complete len:925 (-) Transcript_7126:377-3151(-)